MTQAPEQSSAAPVRARSGRRPLPPLIFLLVLAVAALLVWWNVLQDDKTTQSARSAAAASEAPPSLDPKTVHLRVLNATDQAGLAQDVAARLKERGFAVDEVGNDSSGRSVTGVGEIRHGPRGNDQARYVALYVPGAESYADTRATAQVDVIIGPGFTQLAAPEQVAAALSGAPSSPAA